MTPSTPPPRPPRYLIAAALALFLAVLAWSSGCAPDPDPAETVCQAAEDCGALGGMTRARCVETFSPGPAVAGMGSERCADAVAADSTILCPFLTTGDATTIPEECVMP